MLEDVDQIEVTRGSGATLWGANAVNGVINIITKRAEETQGGLIWGGYGNEEQGSGGVCYGGKAGANAHYRVYGKYFNRSELVEAGGAKGFDAWQMGRGGARLDWTPSAQETLTLQGDLYQGGEHQTFRSFLFVPPSARTSNRTFL